MRLKLILFASLALAGAILWFSQEKKVDYNTEVKPLLNKKCLACHGGVKQSGHFSLLTRQEALQPAESGKSAIVPGKPGRSEFIRRLTCGDPEERMPKGEEPLNADEVALLTRWVRQGALWGDHWAYQSVREPAVPTARRAAWGWFSGKRDADWGHNSLDAFVLDGLKKAELQPSPEAPKAALLRRVALDLTGLPADEALTARFMADESPEAYERIVDTLLANPAFGERWAAVWLDLARYADTKGYERDDRRNAWRYRDWLIRAFNADMPYDQFLTEQLAGDLLPNPTDAQLIATQFHRNTPTNDEGGTDNEEFRVAAVIDRVNTTWEGILGTSFACIQCHSHPYDPFFHDEYYKFYAFFNNSRDADTYEDYPLARWFAGTDSLKMLDVQRWLGANANPLEKEQMMQLARFWQPVRYSVETDQFQNASLLDTKWLGIAQPGSARLPGVNFTGKTRLIIKYQCREAGGALTIRRDSLTGPVIGKLPLPAKTEKGWAFASFDVAPVEGVHPVFLCYDNPKLKGKPSMFGIQFDWFALTIPFPGKDKPGYAAASKQWWELLTAQAETSPIMWENPADFQRSTHVFERGNWLVPGKAVQPATPRYLPPMPEGAPNNRLGLARWITSKEHPLTARVLVNRLWEQVFGVGLVETIEDFGTQGFEPTHPGLLDHLAWRTMHAHNWSVKKILREIALSATYRQASEVTPEVLALDPANRMLGRGPKVRLSAEQIRDQALAVSGLLSRKQFGLPVMPYQPEGIWNTPWNDQSWATSLGEDQYRRAIYTYWKRSSPYPSMITFDGAGRQICTARRVRTNTPLQALVTLNDPVYVEAAKHFALRMQRVAGHDPVRQIAEGYNIACGKPLSPQKQAVLMNLYAQSLQRFLAKPQEMCDFIQDLPDQHHAPETAALAMVANALLNLDEVVAKQ